MWLKNVRTAYRRTIPQPRQRVTFPSTRIPHTRWRTFTLSTRLYNTPTQPTGTLNATSNPASEVRNSDQRSEKSMRNLSNITGSRILTDLQQGRVGHALSTLMRCHNLNIPINTRVYNSLMHVALRQNDNALFSQVLNLLMSANVPFDRVTYIAVLTWCRQQKNDEEFDRYWNKLLSENPDLIDDQIIKLLLFRHYNSSWEVIDEIVQIAQKHNVAKTVHFFKPLFRIYLTRKNSQAFLSLYESYLNGIKSGEITPSPYVLACVAAYFALPTQRPIENIKELWRIVYHLMNCKEFVMPAWERLLLEISRTGLMEFFATLFVYFKKIKQVPTLPCFTAYCRCLFISAMRRNNRDLLVNSTKPRSGASQNQKPGVRNVLVDVEVKRILEWADMAQVKLDDVCYNYILMALAKSNHLKSFFELLAQLEDMKMKGEGSFTMNMYGYAGLIIATTDSVELSVSQRLKTIMALWNKAKAAPQFNIMEKYRSEHPLQCLNHALLYAFAKLNGPDMKARLKQVMKELDEANLSPPRMHALSYVFRDLQDSKEGFENLLSACFEQWPHLEPDNSLVELYARTYYLDLIKQGKMSLLQQNPNIVRQNVIDILDEVRRRFNTVHGGVLIILAKDYAMKHNPQAVFTLRELVASGQLEFVQRRDDMSWLWHYSVMAVSKINYEEALRKLDEMRNNGFKPSTSTYSVLVTSCPDPSRVGELYDMMKADGLTIDSEILRLMVIATMNKPEIQQRLIKEAALNSLPVVA